LSSKTKFRTKILLSAKEKGEKKREKESNHSFVQFTVGSEDEREQAHVEMKTNKKEELKKQKWPKLWFGPLDIRIKGSSESTIFDFSINFLMGAGVD
jgi:hypothetical protein